MLCEMGQKLKGKFDLMHREQEIAEMELARESANRGQSERRLAKVHEVEHGAELILRRHVQECEVCSV